VSGLCRVLRVGEAAYYAWRGGKTYRLSQTKSELAKAVKEVFWLHRRRYGARGISAELLTEGLPVGRRLASSLMKKPRFNGDPPEAICAEDDRFKASFRVSSESVEGREQ